MGFEIKKKPEKNDNSGDETPNTKHETEKPSGFLKSGAAAKKLMQKAEAEAKAKKESAGKAYRFWLKPGDDAHITFVDGRIDENTGILDISYASEHRVKVNNRWEDFICIEDHGPCPLCEAGEKKSFVGYLTVIDHRVREYEKDGKTVKVEATKRLFVAKTDTLKQLTKMAEKLDNGLIGVTYEVSRTGDKKAAVGDLFDRIAIHEMSELEEAFGDDAKVIDYDAELPFVSAEDMAELGIGKKVSTFGKKSGTFGSKKDADDIDDTQDKPW